ncbi:MATE family efflux transporter [Algoriphagus zhangzhouensis]|uniref:Multidrug-efflux transporter n=1 Tax=Algoriphagus zhangzhouensis TaxID=1073327 RepID=A0A1M7Z4Q4_9BACT|nr:MATE family efflux transporter [Algoriphagus zhangzhouensis]TDY48722.1 putative MATE family efflux protein [Algoriphagus zhangzhouensis]SHO59855.1 putative efflux protein, MATE family [Algoriphagus zhangzhouensis]
MTFQLIKDAILGKEQDFTVLSLKTAIMVLAIPMILEMMMESAFAVVDIFFVAKLGESAIATVGLTESVIVLVYAIGFGISMAATALISRRFGEKEYEKAGDAAFQLLLVGGGISVLLGLGGWFLAKDILQLMGAEADVLEIGVSYAKIIFAGNSAIMLLFLINGAFRGAGQPHLAMRALWIANGFNIVLDPLFIFGFGSWAGWGLDGAAIATTLGRGLGVLYQLYHLFNGKHKLHILTQNIKVRWKTIRKILDIAIGGMGQFLIDSVAWLALTRMNAEFGSAALAGYTIAMRVLIFTILPAWGLSGAAATLVGQNLGAKHVGRAEEAVWLTTKYNVIFMASVTGIYLLFSKQLAGFFTDIPEVQDIAAQGLWVIVLGYVFFAIGMVLTQAFNGAGDTKTPAWINIGVLWCIEVPLAWALAFPLGFGFLGIFIAIAFAHSFHALVSLYFFKRGKWKRMAV